MKNFLISSIAVFILVIIISPFFLVKEGEVAIVEQFSRLKVDENEKIKVYPAGLHFKVPMIDKVKKLDAKIQTLEDTENRFLTAEQKYVIVNYYAKWRINDFGQYYMKNRSGDSFVAKNRLATRLNNDLRIEFGARTISQIVSGQRDELMIAAKEKMANYAKDIGIEIIDVRVKTINLPNEIRNAIFDRMRAERSVVAREHRSKGREEAEIIRAITDRKVTTILAKAEKESRTTKGQADAEVAKILAQSHNKDPEFYGFWRSLDAYKKSFNSKNDIIVIKPDNDFFKYMQNFNEAN